MKPALLMAVAALALPVAAAAAPAGGGPPGGHGAMPSDRAPGPTVAVAFAAFAPTTVGILAGDTVRWSNGSFRAHTVTAEDGSFDSGRVGPKGTFERRFDAVGVISYYCRLHSFMRGEVDVHRMLLDPQREPAAPRRPYALTGRAALPEGTGVTIQADPGGGFRDVATATVGEGGAFRTVVTPSASTSYRAVAGQDASHEVKVLVLDRRVSATASTRGRSATVDAVVTPPSPGATVVLQLRLGHRFGWWPVARAKVARDGRARLRVPIGRSVPARVALTLADGATRLATSRTFSVGR